MKVDNNPVYDEFSKSNIMLLSYWVIEFIEFIKFLILYVLYVLNLYLIILIVQELTYYKKLAADYESKMKTSAYVSLTNINSDSVYREKLNAFENFRRTVNNQLLNK